MQSVRRSGKAFEELISNLFSEIELAVKWQRPSILIAVYRSESVYSDAEASLEKRLLDSGVEVGKIQVSEQAHRILAAIAALEYGDRSAVFVTGLNRGGGSSGSDVYHELNLQREFFVEHRIRIVFWVTEKEAGALAEKAPDFWAFRHRVIDFTRPRAVQRGLLLWEQIAWHEWTALLFEDYHIKMASCEKLLADLPDSDQGLSLRVDLLYKLASFFWAGQEYSSALEMLQQGVQIVAEIDEPRIKSRLLTGIGHVYASLQEYQEAQSHYHLAAAADAADPAPWVSLIETYRQLGKRSDSVKAFKRVARISPTSPESWNNIGIVNHDLGRYDEALSAYRKALAIAPNEIVPLINLGYLCMEKEDHQEAQQVFGKAVGLYPDSGIALRGLGRAYLQDRRFQDARITLEEAARADSMDILSHLSLALCYQKAGENLRAVELLDQVKEQMGVDVEDYLLAVYWAIAANEQFAIKHLGAAIRNKRVTQQQVDRSVHFDLIRHTPAFQEILACCQE
ncbi:MAG: tetratricopeptide repeat protein [Anaerolineales bacterium]|nr:tetratricopeptide repeat protein [Anaerolineales bacterium]